MHQRKYESTPWPIAATISRYTEVLLQWVVTPDADRSMLDAACDELCETARASHVEAVDLLLAIKASIREEHPGMSLNLTDSSSSSRRYGEALSALLECYYRGERQVG